MSLCLYPFGFRNKKKKALPHPTEFVQSVSKGVCCIGSALILRRAIHKYAVCLQSTINGLHKGVQRRLV